MKEFLKLERLLILRNRKPFYYFVSGCFFSVFNLLFLLFVNNQFYLEHPINTSVLLIIFLSPHTLMYSIFSFSWEGNYMPMLVLYHQKLKNLVRLKWIFNTLLSTFFFVIGFIVFSFRYKQDFMLMYVHNYLISVFFLNTFILFLTSHVVFKIDLFNNNFEIIKYPPLLHIPLTVAIAVITVVFPFIFNQIDTLIFKTIYLISFVGICILFTIKAVKIIINNLSKK